MWRFSLGLCSSIVLCLAAAPCVSLAGSDPGAQALASTAPARTAATVASASTATRVAGPTDGAAVDDHYLVQPGDVLQVTVWKEQDLTTEVLVRPDGGFSFPLVGDFVAAGKTVEQLRTELAERLKRYIPNPVVTVATKQVGGNHVYVVGKVQRPGEYPFVRPLDVMQALSLAGGTTAYASLNKIMILHRENGTQRAIRFRYSDVAHGKSLAQNIVLQAGDTVVVP
jgi:polysaccharide export outer membrane protein